MCMRADATARKRLEFLVTDADAGERLDRYIAGRLQDSSRSYLQTLIRSSLVLVDGSPSKAAQKLRRGQAVSVTLPAPKPTHLEPEQLAIDIIHEDEDIIVLDKPAGMPAHVSEGHEHGTLVHALLFHCGESLSGVGSELRPGIVHRLDMETSGVMVAAKSDRAHRNLSEQFRSRRVEKSYLALAHGPFGRDEAAIEAPIGRSVSDPRKKKVRIDGKPAATAISVLERLKDDTILLEARPKTGRTHQIRVHLAYVHCPVLCDKLYGREQVLRDGEGQVVLSRHALHAHTLAFDHPVTGRRVGFSCGVPEDFRRAAESLGATPDHL